MRNSTLIFNLLSLFSSLFCLSQNSCLTCDGTVCLTRTEEIVRHLEAHTYSELTHDLYLDIAENFFCVLFTWTSQFSLKNTFCCNLNRYGLCSIILLPGFASIEGCETLWHFDIPFCCLMCLSGVKSICWLAKRIFKVVTF